MAKGGISKGSKGKKAPSLHSRAARRATSPGIDTDKSLKNLKPPAESINRRPAVLAAHHSGGITKKSKTGRKAVMSTKARRRHEKGLDRAEVVVDRTEKKLQKSKGQARVIKARSKPWDEVNKEIPPPDARDLAVGLQDGEDDDAGSYADTDEEMDVPDGEPAQKDTSLASQSTPLAPVPAPVLDDEDEIL